MSSFLGGAQRKRPSCARESERKKRREGKRAHRHKRGGERGADVDLAVRHHHDEAERHELVFCFGCWLFVCWFVACGWQVMMVLGERGGRRAARGHASTDANCPPPQATKSNKKTHAVDERDEADAADDADGHVDLGVLHFLGQRRHAVKAIVVVMSSVFSRRCCVECCCVWCVVVVCAHRHT